MNPNVGALLTGCAVWAATGSIGVGRNVGREAGQLEVGSDVGELVESDGALLTGCAVWAATGSIGVGRNVGREAGLLEAGSDVGELVESDATSSSSGDCVSTGVQVHPDCPMHSPDVLIRSQLVADPVHRTVLSQLTLKRT